MAKNTGKNGKPGGTSAAGKSKSRATSRSKSSATSKSKSSGSGKRAKAQSGGASKAVESDKLIEYIAQAAGKERHIEAALAAHLVMTTRPAYHGRLEEHLKATKVRAEKLEDRLKETGGNTRSIPAAGAAVMGEVKDAAKMVADRAVSLAKGPLEAMRDDHEAQSLLENARVEYKDACEQMGTYTVVRTLAKAAGDKKTVKLAKDFRDEHADMAEFVENLIPKLAHAVVKTEVRGKTRSSSSANSSSSSSSSRARNGAGAQRSRAGSSSSGTRSTSSKATTRSSSRAGSGSSSSKSGRSNTSGGSTRSGSSGSSGSGGSSSTARSGGSRGSGQRRTAAKS